MGLYHGSFHRSPGQQDHRTELRVQGGRRVLGEDGRPNYEQCCFCGEPAQHWPTFPVGKPPVGELALNEEYTFAMCGVCLEECDTLRGLKKKQYERHLGVMKDE